MTTGKQPIMTIKGQVYQIIKNEICNGAFPPGYWLQEPELARRLASAVPLFGKRCGSWWTRDWPWTSPTKVFL